MTHTQKNEHQKIRKLNGQPLQDNVTSWIQCTSESYVTLIAVTPLVHFFLNHKTHLLKTGL